MPARARHLALAALLLAALSPAPAARAGTLPFRGEVGIVFFPFILAFEGSGVASVNGDGTGGPLTALALPPGVFRATALDFPGVGGIAQIRVTAANGAGNFTGLGPQGGGGVMPLSGVVKFCILVACDTATTVLSLPLDPVGAGGSARVMGDFAVTVEGRPWTRGMTTLSTPGAVTRLEGFAHGPLSGTTSTAQLGGVLELVTPAFVHTSIPGLEELTGYAILRVEFVPEPASAPLLALGLLLLSAGARRRR
jgi:hypothetical protein